MIKRFFNWLKFWKKEEEPIALINATGHPLFVSQLTRPTQRSIATLQARCERLLYAQSRASNRGDLETAKRLTTEIGEKQAEIEKLMEVLK